NKAGNQGARIAHEDPGLVHIVTQKAQGATSQAKGHKGIFRAVKEKESAKTKGDEQDNRSCQAIQPVYKVNGIGNAYNYQKGKEITDAKLQLPNTHKALQAGNAHLAHEHHNKGGNNLYKEFLKGRNRNNIVLYTNKEHDDTAC